MLHFKIKYLMVGCDIPLVMDVYARNVAEAKRQFQNYVLCSSEILEIIVVEDC